MIQTDKIHKIKLQNGKTHILHEHDDGTYARMVKYKEDEDYICRGCGITVTDEFVADLDEQKQIETNNWRLIYYPKRMFK